ncbi:MAG: acyltransferase family protein [Duncaniella sp.]|nr:acyltransferase family protein [Duncaniella sp.]
MASKRNTSIEALRFLFMLQICIWHNSSGFGTMQAGFLGVEFFFFLSGLFLYRAAVRPDAPGILEYLRRKLSKFYPAYVAATLLSFCVFAKVGIMGFLYAPVETALKLIGQLLMIQATGVGYFGVNNALWFFSVLVYGGALVYALVRYYPGLSIHVLFPAASLLFFVHILADGGGFEHWGESGFLYSAMARGTVEIAYGALVGHLYFGNRHAVEEHRRLLDVASVVAVLLYVPIIFTVPGAQAYVLILFPVMLIAALTRGSLIERVFAWRGWLWLGRLSFDMFLIHLMLIHGCSKYLPSLGLTLPMCRAVYCIILIPCAWGFGAVVRRLGSIMVL